MSETNVWSEEGYDVFAASRHWYKVRRAGAEEPLPGQWSSLAQAVRGAFVDAAHRWRDALTNGRTAADQEDYTYLGRHEDAWFEQAYEMERTMMNVLDEIDRLEGKR
jgi:hypothetical protein